MGVVTEGEKELLEPAALAVAGDWAPLAEADCDEALSGLLSAAIILEEEWAADGGAGPAAGIRPRRGRVVFQERRQQDKSVHLMAMGAARETDDEAAALHRADGGDDRSRGANALGGGHGCLRYRRLICRRQLDAETVRIDATCAV